jgi:hypothetical protein
MKTADWGSAVTILYALAYKAGSRSTRGSAIAALVAVAISASAIHAGGLVAPSIAEPQRGETAITCTNPFSGTSWQIKIDYGQRTVDSNPADISDSTISWRDSTNGWKYMLDRKSGKLTVTLASATGGNFLYDQCTLDR